MKTTWIISSAINTNVGVYDPTIRTIQTHETINSIQKYYPDAQFILVEAGNPMPEDDELYNRLKGRCQAVLNMTDNEQIRHLQSNFLNKMTNKNEMGGATGLTKTVAELTIMAAVLDAFKSHDDLAPALAVDRIFKISGRYQLSPLFEPAVYETEAAAGRYVFRQRDPSWMPDAKEAIGTDHGFSSRLWSFTPEQLDDLIVKLDSMIEDCLAISTNHYIDIEHLLFKHIGPDNALELEHTHLFGSIAPTGTVIYD
jgi:hypothetical protein